MGRMKTTNLMRKTRLERLLSPWLCLGFLLLVLSCEWHPLGLIWRLTDGTCRCTSRLAVNIFIARFAGPQRSVKWGGIALKNKSMVCLLGSPIQYSSGDAILERLGCSGKTTASFRVLNRSGLLSFSIALSSSTISCIPDSRTAHVCTVPLPTHVRVKGTSMFDRILSRAIYKTHASAEITSYQSS
jgi:hypothetical protein